MIFVHIQKETYLKFQPEENRTFLRTVQKLSLTDQRKTISITRYSVKKQVDIKNSQCLELDQKIP